jgi:hypothetical protein
MVLCRKLPEAICQIFTKNPGLLGELIPFLSHNTEFPSAPLSSRSPDFVLKHRIKNRGLSSWYSAKNFILFFRTKSGLPALSDLLSSATTSQLLQRSHLKRWDL